MVCSVKNFQVLVDVHGGLGDALQYSTLPEQFATQLGQSTFLSNSYCARNPEIVEFVWGTNPYIKGWSSASPTIGSVRKYAWTAGQTFIENIEQSNGLSPVSKSPKVYFQPNTVSELRGHTLVDVSAVTLSRGPFKLDLADIAYFLQKQKELSSDIRFSFVNFSKLNAPENMILAETLGDSIWEVNSLREYADGLASAAGLIGLHSGAIALGAAILEHNSELRLECLVSPALAALPMQTIEKVHVYKGVSYIPLG